jgi:DNA-binding response OmpR family regulator
LVLFLCEPVTTTGLEFNLLVVLMADPGSLVSREVIAQRIFQRKLSSCDKSINSHVTNLRKKLLAISSHQVIKTIKGQGYIFLNH